MNIGNVIRCDIARLQRHGFEIRRKTAGEIMEDCAAHDARAGAVVKPSPKRVRRKKARNYTDAQRKAALEAVHVGIREGLNTMAACEAAGVTHTNFASWRKRYNITEPALPGRIYTNKREQGTEL